MKVNTKHITLALVLAILSFGLFAMTIGDISSNGRELQGHPITLLVNWFGISMGLFFVYLAKWMHDTEKTKQNLK